MFSDLFKVNCHNLAIYHGLRDEARQRFKDALTGSDNLKVESPVFIQIFEQKYPAIYCLWRAPYFIPLILYLINAFCFGNSAVYFKPYTMMKVFNFTLITFGLMLLSFGVPKIIDDIHYYFYEKNYLLILEHELVFSYVVPQSFCNQKYAVHQYLKAEIEGICFKPSETGIPVFGSRVSTGCLVMTVVMTGEYVLS